MCRTDTRCELKNDTAKILTQIFPKNDERSLAMVFNSLSTAQPGIQGDVPSLQSCLYEYQRESVAAMMEMEKPGRIMNDPLMIPLHSPLNGGNFYLQPTTLEVLANCPQVCQGRGGILCEELGKCNIVYQL